APGDPAEAVRELLPLAAPLAAPLEAVLAFPAVPSAVLAALPLPGGPAPDVTGLPGFSGLPGLLLFGADAPGALGRVLQLLPQVADGVADVALHGLRDVADRLGDLPFQVLQVPAAVAQFGTALVGEPVDLASVDLLVGDQPLLLQAGEIGRASCRGRGWVAVSDVVHE